MIVPCGLTDKGVTSIVELIGRDVEPHAVEDAVIHAFCAVFERQPLPEQAAMPVA
jgi:lipoyl(octanoyl) transferase